MVAVTDVGSPQAETPQQEETMSWTLALAAASITITAALTLAAPRAAAADARQMEANKQAAADFYDKAINQKDFDAAAKYIGSRYVQHNPNAADGPEGLKAFLGVLREKFPSYHSEIKRTFADGDYVILHVHNVPVPGARGRAIIDIFKFENGKIVEHWDVAQEIPEKPANSNGMF
jgi:predicted SnoaL-like aldol condensation-catalyzing enzyme